MTRQQGRSSVLLSFGVGAELELVCLLLLVLCPSGTSGQKTGPCRCNYDENQWLHLISEAVSAAEGGRRLPDVLSAVPDSDTAAAAQARMTVLVQQRRCDRDAKAFPDTDTAVDFAQLDQLPNACIPGQVFLSTLCVHKFVLQGEIKPAVVWLQSMKQLLATVEQCMDSESPFPVRVAELKDWAAHWSTNRFPEAQGAELMAAVGFPGAIELRPNANNGLQHCLPLKDPDCFPPNTANANEACHSCCNTDIHGAQGNPQCWEGPYTFQRCCGAAAIESPPAAEAEQSQNREESPTEPLVEPRGCDKAELCQEEMQLSHKLGKQLEDQSKQLEDQRRQIEDLGKQLEEQGKQLEDVEKSHKESSKAGEDHRVQLEKTSTELQNCKLNVEDFTKRLEDKVSEVAESQSECKTIITDKDARAKMLESGKEAEAQKAKKFKELSQSLKLELEESRKETTVAQKEAAVARAEASALNAEAAKAKDEQMTKVAATDTDGRDALASMWHTLGRPFKSLWTAVV